MFFLYFTKEAIKSAIKNLYYDSIWIPNFYLTSPKFPGDVDIVFLIVLLHLAGFMLLLICFKSRSGWFPKLSVWESLKSREHNPRSTNKHVAYLRCGWRLGQCNKSPMNAPVHRMMNVLTVAETFNKTHQRSDFCRGSLFSDVVNQLQITISLLCGSKILMRRSIK